MKKNCIKSFFLDLYSAADSAECTNIWRTDKVPFFNHVTADISQMNFSVQLLFSQH